MLQGTAMDIMAMRDHGASSPDDLVAAGRI